MDKDDRMVHGYHAFFAATAAADGPLLQPSVQNPFCQEKAWPRRPLSPAGIHVLSIHIIPSINPH